MPQQRTDEAQAHGGGDGDGTGHQEAAGDPEGDVEVTKIKGNMKLRISPPLQLQLQGQQQGGRQATTPTTQVHAQAQVQQETMEFSFDGTVELQDDGSAEAQRRKWFKEMRGWLMVLATVAASVTYQAGLNPPGGFWQDNAADKSHVAGDPALRDTRHSRYMLFYYFNATAFVMSLVIMVLLMSERFYHTEGKVLALLLATIVDLASLIGAYIAGTTRFFSSCIYVIVITCVAFVAIIYIGEGMTEICYFVMVTFPCMENLSEKKWCPIPAEVVRKAKGKKEQRKRRLQSKRRPGNNGGCCRCCA